MRCSINLYGDFFAKSPSNVSSSSAHAFFFTFFSLAGCIAQKMGLPIRLVTVVNSNDIIHRTVQHGDFSLAGSVKATLASAMDIQVCSKLAKM